MQVSATSFAQQVTLSKKNITISELFDEVYKQTGYTVVWKSDQLKGSTTLDAKFSKTPLSEVISKTLQGKQLSFEIEDNTVLIKPSSEKSIVEKVIAYFQSIDVRGRVVDENGNGLAGATIKVKGTGKSVLSNSEGEFYLNNVEENVILIISYLGYKTREVTALSQLETISMEILNSDLDEVTVNAGYYTVSNKNRTGNISRVTSETIAQQPVNNPVLALQNRVPGLLITQQTGMPGGGVSVQIRGRNSINTAVGNDPLYIIDGVVYPSNKVSPSLPILGLDGASPLSMVNPNDIESIEILKDADATSIYGSRGANGVILIKTKRGSIGSLRINASINQGISQVDKRLDLLNTQQYLELRKEAYFINGKLTTSSPTYINQNDINGNYDQSKYTDWQKELIGRTANTTTSSLNISGGSDKINYLLGANYYQEGSVFPGNFGYKRGGMTSSLNVGTEKDRLNISFIANYNHVQSSLMKEDITYNIYLPPNYPDLLDKDGQLNWSNNTLFVNPLASLQKLANSGSDNLIANIALKYRLLNHLFLKASIGYNMIKRDDHSIVPLSSFSPALSLTATAREATFSNTFNNTLMVEPQLTYKNKFGPGNFDTLLGMSIQSNNNESRNLIANGFNSDGLMDNISSASTLISRLSAAQYRYIAVFARFNYNLYDKYVFNLTARRDGSSRFGDDKRFANFGAIGAAWIFSEENMFKKHFAFLSFGKLRGSYGITGNDQIPDYQYLQLWAPGQIYQSLPTNIPNNLGNKDFSWETNRKLEAALQLGFVKNRLNIEISWYRNRSSNQLIGDPLPPSTGNSLIVANRPATVQNIGWEMETNYKLINSESWQWFTGINMTVPKNKLISYPDIENSSDAYNYVVGKPLSTKRIYNVRGINSQTGLYDIEDYDNNGIINNNDRYLNKFTGIYFYGGFQNSISFKSVSLDFLIAFTKQRSSLNYMNIGLLPGYLSRTLPTSNYPTIVLQRWQQIGDVSSIPKVSATLGSNYTNYSNARDNGGESITNSSFVRLKNVSISYNVPKAWLQRINLSNAKFTLQGQNLLTYTNYIGLDPENQAISYLPPLRSMTLGLNLTL
ncbi:TonB-linked outer membrane protein, SusC/RagA family [Pedobacter westerhofensis]|uniref:TonB-linked outer membrane protein, SusC/RagA family n=2 Tax=Pedobacter westerhofensis TaxID=425512 RepID=A0A521EAR9_9SPHI|nr:TonB-linked outer membrane protein, SusC/RagA family [Pedobacter westerhofensis]